MATQTHRFELSSDQDAWKLFVFRKTRDVLPAEMLVNDLKSAVQLIHAEGGPTLDALVRCGEIETAMADSGSPQEATFVNITDGLAALACGAIEDPGKLLCQLEETTVTGDLRCSFPEGFSYYGLNPLDFADIAKTIVPLRKPHAAVIGVRSVGSTLAAVVSVTLRKSGVSADRITVRPQGEPYHRSTKFSADQLLWIRQKLQVGAEFFIVDEGPGFSGSTIVSVARALEQAGVEREAVTVLCSRSLDEGLMQTACGRELSSYRFLTTGYGRRVPEEADRRIGSGLWREMFFRHNSCWPACWTDLERIKHLSVDETSLFKFEGFGRFGSLAQSQAKVLAEGGFSPELLAFTEGFARYSLVNGRPLHCGDLDAALMTRMAEYCAFRARALAAPSNSTQRLLNMLQVNLEVEFGCKSPIQDVPLVLPVYPDCRMMPHEWCASQSGRIIKTDSVGHGEGHQIPGPADIAWDLAGAIAEWDMSTSEKEFFLDEYHRFSGDDAAGRIGIYLLLYSSYRMAHCRMGAASMRESFDGGGLWREYQRHSQMLRGLLAAPVDRGCLQAA